MKNLHPLASVLYFVLIAAITAAAADPPIILTSLAAGAIFAVLTGVGRLWIYALTILGVAAVNPLFFHQGETPLFFINNSPITMESVLSGISIGAMIGAVMLWFAAYNKITDTQRHLYIFARFTPRLGIMLGMALRFAPLFGKKYNKIMAAQKAMGMYSSQTFIDRLVNHMSVFGATVTWCFENGVTTAVSMDARCYGRGKRTSYSLFRFKPSDAAFMLLSVGAAAAVALNWGELQFSFYPALAPLNRALFPRGAHLVLCLMPIATEITERIKWKYSMSKISASPTPGKALPL